MEANPQSAKRPDRDIIWNPVGGKQQSGSQDIPPTLAESLLGYAEGGDGLREAYRRRVQYVRFLAENDMTGREELRGFLADLRTDEAATVERIQRAHEG